MKKRFSALKSWRPNLRWDHHASVKPTENLRLTSALLAYSLRIATVSTHIPDFFSECLGSMTGEGAPLASCKQNFCETALRHDTSDEPRQLTGRRLLIVNHRTCPTVKSGNSSNPCSPYSSRLFQTTLRCVKFRFVLNCRNGGFASRQRLGDPEQLKCLHFATPDGSERTEVPSLFSSRWFHSAKVFQSGE